MLPKREVRSSHAVMSRLDCSVGEERSLGKKRVKGRTQPEETS